MISHSLQQLIHQSIITKTRADSAVKPRYFDSKHTAVPVSHLSSNVVAQGSTFTHGQVELGEAQRAADVIAGVRVEEQRHT